MRFCENGLVLSGRYSDFLSQRRRVQHSDAR